MTIGNFFNRFKDQLQQVMQRDGAAEAEDVAPDPSSARRDPASTGGVRRPSAEVAAPIPSSERHGRPSADVAAPIPSSEGGSGVGGLRYRQSGETPRPPSAGIEQSNPNDSVYEERSEQVQRVDAMFSECSPSVKSHILTQSLVAGGVRRLIEKVGLTSRGRDGADLAQLAKWMEQHGDQEFCSRVGLRQPGAPPRPPIQPRPEDAETIDFKVKALAPKKTGGYHGEVGRIPATPGPRPRAASDTGSDTRPNPSATQKVSVQPTGLNGQVNRLRETQQPTPAPAPAQPPPPPVQEQPAKDVRVVRNRERAPFPFSPGSPIPATPNREIMAQLASEQPAKPAPPKPAPKAPPTTKERSSAEFYMDQLLDDE